MVKGKIVVHRYESRVLRANPLKDPSAREVIIYLPPDYSNSYSKGYVTIFILPGFGSQGRTLLNIDPLGENLEQRMNRLISQKKCGPMIFVLLDCFTKFGGNQYLNSSATGKYEDYILKEIVPFVDKNYNVSKRAVFGHSSGGYGSLMLAMRHPELFHGIVDHAGDAGFEYCYLPDFPKAFKAYAEYGGPRNWLENFWRKPSHQDRQDGPPLNVFAMAAHYSPNPESREMGVDIPFNLKTGEILPQVWNRWLRHDPARIIGKYRNNLKRLRFIYLDCGSDDEFNLHLGARVIHSKLESMSINHYYEEFNGGHMHTSFRYDHSLPMTYSKLS
ncbi:MAG TPA: alpha/beta hydrolase-fold protein [Nitrososphaeraceae archaeon]|nr:alpha/beta hydrolase-fold protein [Nitrososphaeraceae archaeon]